MRGLLVSEELRFSFFTEGGESISKGYGHILSENFEDGLLFLISRYTSLSMMFSFSLLIVFNGNLKLRRLTNILLRLVFIVAALYLIAKSIDIRYNNYDGINRITEVGIIWLCWATSYFFAFVSVRLILKK
jgi:hypothetical protein